MYGYAHVNAGICRGPAVLNTLELDLQVVMRLLVLGTKQGSLEEQQVLLVADSPSSSLSHLPNIFVVITVNMCGGNKRRDKVTERRRARANTHVSQYL